MFDGPDEIEAHGFRLDGEARLLHERLDVRPTMEILISEM